MSPPLLQTKVGVPPKPPIALPRQRLLQRLDETLNRQLTLVAAPAGSGKSTLLSTWVDTLNMPVSWLSLDREDNDPAQFFTYWWKAFQKSNLGIAIASLDTIGMGADFSWRHIITTFINQMASFSGDLVFVFEDYHLIENNSIHQALSYLLNHQPTNLHLVIVTRSDPPLPLAGLRGRGQLVEVRVDDLRFNQDEIKAYLARAGISVDNQTAEILEQRTEGWAVGIQLASQSLVQNTNVSQFLTDFAETKRYLLDYLVEEVLEKQPDHIQDFFLCTSILNKFNASLCNTVTGRDNSQQILDHLEIANLFVVPLDISHQWYRYHTLFADLLRHRIQRKQPDLVAEAHRRAYQWFIEHEYIGEAIHHAQAAGDRAQAVSFIVEYAMPTLQAGQQFTLLRWIEAIPEEVRRQYPALLLWHAWVLLFVGCVDEYQPSIELAARIFEEQGDKHGQGQVLTFQANLARLRGDARTAVEQAHHAQALLPKNDQLQRGTNILTLGDGYIQLGDIERARPFLAEAQAQGRSLGNLLMELIALNRTADGYLLQGQLQRAAEVYHQVLSIAGERPIWQRAEAQNGLAKIHLEWNELQEAESRLRLAFQLAEDTDRQVYLADMYLTQAHLDHAHGDSLRSAEALNQALVTARHFDHETTVRRVEATQARLYLRQGDIRSAAYWLDMATQTPSTHPLLYEMEGFTAVRVLLAQERSSEALIWLEKLEAPAQDAGRAAALIELNLLASLTHAMAGEQRAALDSLHQSLLLAEPSRYLRLYVDEGQPVHDLLQQVHKVGILPHYVERILEVISPSSDAGLVEPLTEREMDVLHLIALGYTNQQIADELVIALTTTKKHVSNIIGKLAVDNRTEAAAKARQIGYL